MNLIDSDILIDAAHNKTEAIAFLRGLENIRQSMSISVVTYLELIVGCRNKQEQREVQKLSTRFNFLHISESILTRAKDLVEMYFLSHGLLIPDALIAATALENDITFFTKNIRHFQMIEGLKVNRPY